MAVLLSEEADADMSAIFSHLAREAGFLVAQKYIGRFDELFERLALFPEIGKAWPDLGAEVRLCVVAPYLVIYRMGGKEINILRLLHGRQNVTRELLVNE